MKNLTVNIRCEMITETTMALFVDGRLTNILAIVEE